MDNKEEEKVMLEPRGAKELLLRIDDPGVYTYVCAVLTATFPEAHADKGMFGTLIVE